MASVPAGERIVGIWSGERMEIREQEVKSAVIRMNGGGGSEGQQALNLV